MFTESRLKRAAVSGLFFFAAFWAMQDLVRDGDVARLFINLGGAVLFAVVSFFADAWREKRKARSFAEVHRKIREITERPS